MQCPNCKKLLTEEVNFCPYCGQKLENKPAAKQNNPVGELMDNLEELISADELDELFKPAEEVAEEKKPTLEEEDHFSPFSIGDIVNHRYQIKELIGRGGMGVVYKVYDTLLNEDIALKVLLPSLMRSKDALERFQNEAKVSLKLSHANIVRVRDLGATENVKFITMELLEGINLREWMLIQKNRNAQVGIGEAITFVKQICEGLNYAHKFTVHRDIKPENIMVLRSLKIKITDFGIARLLTPVKFASTVMSAGTAYYMAPEQNLASGTIDARADIFSVGVIFYELLTGRIPIGRFKLPSKLRSELTDQIDAVITKALEPDPNDRYGTIYEMLKDILIVQEKMKSYIAKQKRELAKERGEDEVAVQLEPDFFVYFELGVKFQKQGQYELAIEQYRKAIEMEYNYAKTHNNLASVYFLMGKYNEAIKEYREAIDIKPDYAEAYYNLGMVYEAMKDFDQAIDNFKMVVSLKPDHPRVHLNLAEIYKNQKNYEKTIIEYRAALTINSNNADLHNKLGNSYLLNKQYDEAAAAYKRALKLNPNYEYARKNLDRVEKIKKSV
jgi:serine/threonine protein kinase